MNGCADTILVADRRAAAIDNFAIIVVIRPRLCDEIDEERDIVTFANCNTILSQFRVMRLEFIIQSSIVIRLYFIYDYLPPRRSSYYVCNAEFFVCHDSSQNDLCECP